MLVHTARLPNPKAATAAMPTVNLTFKEAVSKNLRTGLEIADELINNFALHLGLYYPKSGNAI